MATGTIYDILLAGIEGSPVSGVPTSVPYNVGRVSAENSSIAPLNAGVTFTGTAVDVAMFPSIATALKTDQDGILYVEFSPDGTNWDSSIPLEIAADVNEVHKFTVTRRYLRIRFTNTSASNQTYFRLQTLLDTQTQLTSALNSLVQQDADATVVRALDSEIDIASGKYAGFSIVNKFGLNPDVDTASVPEDIWGGDGAYAGWATSAQTVQVFSSSTLDVNTTGTGAWSVRLVGLDGNYNVIAETVNLNGTTPATTTQEFIRAHTAQALTAGSGGVNAGIITFRQSTTTTNVFLQMQAGRNQTNCSSYTVPAGYTAYMRSLHSACNPNITANLDGNIWTRSFGGVFRSRRPFFISDSYKLDDIIFGGLVFTEKSDITVRINTCSANNVGVNAGYDLILVKN